MTRFHELINDADFASELSRATTVDEAVGVFGQRGYNTDEDELRRVFRPDDEVAEAEWDYARDHHGIGETIRRAFSR